MTTTEIIAEIHNDFDTATERLLQQAKRIISRPHVEITSRSERVNKLGFTSSRPSKIGEKVVRKYQMMEQFVKDQQYFQLHYPNYKFIIEDEVKRLCEKWGLLFGDAANYIGDIPEKNIEEIEKFRLREEDHVPKKSSLSDFDIELMRSYFLFSSTPREDKQETKFHQPPFKICAPVKDFNTQGMIMKDGYKLEYIPDPIVLQPVKGGYLVVSKWGAEANDESLVNEILN